MTVIFIGICFWCAPNFIKPGQFLIELWRFNDFKMVDGRHLGFLKFAVYVTWPLFGMPFCFDLQKFAQIGRSLAEFCPKTSDILNIKSFNFWSMHSYMSMSSKMSIYYILVYKISSISHNFSLRYGALMIFKMAAVRHVECRNWQWLFSACQYASSYKIKLKRDNRLMNYGKTAIFNLAAVRHFEFKKIFFGELTGIRFNMCSSTQNFIKVGRFLPRDAYA